MKSIRWSVEADKEKNDSEKECEAGQRSGPGDEEGFASRKMSVWAGEAAERD